MKTYFLAYPCLSVLTLLLLASGNGWAVQRTDEIIAFGDSITQGYPYITASQNGSEVGGYEPTLAGLTDTRNQHFTVYNYGHGGETTVQGLNRFNIVMSQHPWAKYVLILEGTNDIWSSISRQDTVFNLGIMVDKARSWGIEPVVGTLTPDPRSGPGEVKNVPLYNSLIHTMAGNKSVVLAELYDEMVADWVSVYTDSDLLHPNSAGYVKMAEVWFATVFACSTEYQDQCFTRENCLAVGGFWFGGSCKPYPPPLSGTYLLLRTP